MRASGSGVNGLSNFGGYHNCAVLTGGGVSCWGYNGFGQLGNGTNANPVPVGTPVTAGLAGSATAVASGGLPHLRDRGGGGQLLGRQ